MKFYEKISQKYQSDILSNRIKAPLNIIKVIRKHQLDKSRQDNDDFPFYYDEKAGNKPCIFIENLHHTKGKWAGKPFILSPWQIFIVQTLFGWKRKYNDLRRFRELLLIIPRKNGKSQFAAALGLYGLCADGEKAPEIYCGANSRTQALFVYEPARQMILNNSNLKNAFGLVPNKAKLTSTKSNGVFEPVIKNVKDGQSPHFAICDELHQSTDTTMLDAFTTGFGAREQPLLLIISTAGTSLESPLFEKQKVAEKMLDGLIENDTLFPVIYNASPDEDWMDFNVWKKVNPNLNVSLFEFYLKEQLDKAINFPQEKNILLTKHCNIWASSNSAWLNMLKWEKSKDETLSIDDFRNHECFIGLDLANKLDLCSMVKVFKKAGKYYAFGKHYLPSDTINKPGNDLYKRFREEGWIIQTEGARTDYGYILEDIINDCQLFDVASISFDPHEASFLMQQIQNRLGENSSTELIECSQGATSLHQVLTEFEAIIEDGKLVQNDRVLDWCASNCVKRNPTQKYWTIGKTGEKNKIDAVMALVMAIGQAIRGSKSPDKSVYEDEEFELLILE